MDITEILKKKRFMTKWQNASTYSWSTARSVHLKVRETSYQIKSNIKELVVMRTDCWLTPFACNFLTTLANIATYNRDYFCEKVANDTVEEAEAKKEEKKN